MFNCKIQRINIILIFIGQSLFMVSVFALHTFIAKVYTLAKSIITEQK